MLEMIKKISGKKFKVLRKKRTSPAFDQVFDITKLKKVLPQFSFTPMAEALKITYDDFKLG